MLDHIKRLRSRGPANRTTPGGAIGTDYAAEPSATKALSGSTLAFATASALVADAQKWLAEPALNHGWVLMSQSQTHTIQESVASPRRFFRVWTP